MTGCVTKTQLCHKLITYHSLHDFIKRWGLDRVRKWIKGKRAITTYSQQIVQMDDLDGKLNLDSTFKRDGTVISYMDYYSQKKDVFGNCIKLREKIEKALVISHKFKGRVRDRKSVDTIHFLPQLLHVIVSNELQSDNTRQMTIEKSHAGINDIVTKSLHINRKLNDSYKNSLFRTENEPIRVTGMYLPSPLIYINS